VGGGGSYAWALPLHRGLPPDRERGRRRGPGAGGAPPGPPRAGDVPARVHGGLVEPHRHQRIPRRRAPQASPSAVVMADPPDALLPAAPAADEALAATTLPDRMQAALARLPEDFRVAVVLCDVVGESYEQIAESLGIPIGTVRSRIHRARALLRQALSTDGDGDGGV